jgi:hypothetical protein
MSDETGTRLDQLKEIHSSAQSPHQKNLARLKQRFTQLSSMTDVTPEMACAQLMDIVKEAEDLRVKELKGAEDMERKARASRAKADGFSMLSSIVYNIVSRYVSAAERMAAEEAMLEADRLASEDAAKKVARAEARQKRAAKKKPVRQRKTRIKAT